MKLIKFIVMFVGALVLFGACVSTVDSGGGDKIEKADAATSTSKAPAKKSDDPKPDGNFKSACGYELGDFTTGSSAGMRFTADTTLTNTGNVGIVVRVDGKWRLSGGQAVKQSRKVRLPVKAEKDFGFWVPATQDQISAHQNVEAGTNYDGSACKVTVTMVDTF